MHPETSREPGVALIAPGILEQAADWLLRLQAAPGDAATLSACRQWQHAHPQHAQAWARVEQLRGLLGQIPPELALPVLDRAPDPRRRQALKRIAAIAALAAPAGWASHAIWNAAQPGSIERTATGERRRLSLPDGGRLDLATDTAVRIVYGDSLRLLKLQHGQIAIETARDTRQPARPFLVATAHGQLQALGTQFDVRSDAADGSRVAVLEGAVQVMPANRPQAGLVIGAGQSVRFDADGTEAPVAIDESALAWRDGMLAADAMPLGELLGELGRYRRGLLRCEPEAAALRVSGAFPLDDTDRSLRMLATDLPIEVRRHAGGLWTVVAMRSGT